MNKHSIYRIIIGGIFTIQGALNVFLNRTALIGWLFLVIGGIIALDLLPSFRSGPKKILKERMEAFLIFTYGLIMGIVAVALHGVYRAWPLTIFVGIIALCLIGRGALKFFHHYSRKIP